MLQVVLCVQPLADTGSLTRFLSQTLKVQIFRIGISPTLPYLVIWSMSPAASLFRPLVGIHLG